MRHPFPSSRLPRLPAVRLLDPNPYTGWYTPAHAAAFCESELIDRVEDLDLGPLLAPLPVAEVDAILRRPFGTVRELGLEFRAVTPDGQAPGPFDDVEPGLLAVLKEAESGWAGRAAPPESPLPAIAGAESGEAGAPPPEREEGGFSRGPQPALASASPQITVARSVTVRKRWASATHPPRVDASRAPADRRDQETRRAPPAHRPQHAAR